MMQRFILLLAVSFDSAAAGGAERLDYAAADPDLKVVRIDSSREESFLSIRGDSLGRLFVGGREALFLYEPDEKGGYRPRQELYRFPAHSWIYDIELHGDDVYCLTLSALYVIPGAAANERPETLKAKKLIWGVPNGHVHQCFHGLAWGPEGDLYISMGDPLWYYGDFNRPDHWGHWTFFSQPEGTKSRYNGVGGVFRCRPDGSRFQVVARGLRNSCGLCFDRDWNLFTNDNDHEGIPHAYVPGRINHVTPHAYFGWPRGWTPKITPDRAELLDNLFDGMGRSVPVGQTYYDSNFLPPKYRRNLLIARWGIRSVTRYPLKRVGASYRATEHPLLVGRDQARPVGIAVARGGRLFATIAYMAHNEGSPVYRSDLVMITRADDPPAHPFEPVDLRTLAPRDLLMQFARRYWWHRQRVHTEIHRRMDAGQLELNPQTMKDVGPFALRHILWHLLRPGRDHKKADLETAIKEMSNPDIRASREDYSVMLRIFLPAWRSRPLPDNLASLLKKDDPLLQHAALLFYFDRDEPLPKEVLVPAASTDRRLRHTACMLLAQRASRDDLLSLFDSSKSEVRLAGVLAAGFRLTLPPVDMELPKGMKLTPWRNESANIIEYDDGRVDLRKFGPVGTYTMAEYWEAIEPNEEQQLLFGLLQGRLGDRDEAVRLNAANFLFVLNDKRVEPLIERVRIRSERDRLVVAPAQSIRQAWIAGPFPDDGQGFKTVHPPENGVVDVSKTMKVDGRQIRWRKESVTRMYDFRKLSGQDSVTGASCYAFVRIESPRRQQAMLLVGSDDGIRVWQNGKLVHDNDVNRGALPIQDSIFLDLQPGSNDMLIRVRNTTGEHALYLHYRALDSVSYSLPEPLDIAGLADRLKSAASGNAKIGPEFLSVNWQEAVKDGDVDRGRKLFAADGIGCAKCHAIDTKTAVPRGPSLAGAGRRFTLPYLVESILAPNRKVSPVFNATLISTADGRTHSGLVIAETGDRVELLTKEAKRISISKTDIDERKLQDLSPMPAGLAKKPDELRDLLAYLLSVTDDLR